MTGQTRKKTIFLCASMAFYPELIGIQEQLTLAGFTVGVPISVQIMKERNDYDVAHFKDSVNDEQKGEFIRANFKEIAKMDSILVINSTKNGMKGYIGANVLMEIGIAAYLNKKIYVWNPVDANAPYAEELHALGVIAIDQNLSKIA